MRVQVPPPRSLRTLLALLARQRCPPGAFDALLLRHLSPPRLAAKAPYFRNIHTLVGISPRLRARTLMRSQPRRRPCDSTLTLAARRTGFAYSNGSRLSCFGRRP